MNRPLLPIRVEGAWFAIDAPLVAEVLGRRPWVPIPGAPSRAPGVMAWQGRAIPVVDLATLAGAAPARAGEAPRERAVVVRVGPSTLAIPADAVREVHLVEEEALRVPHAARQAFAAREVELNGALMPVLDLAALIQELTPGPAGGAE